MSEAFKCFYAVNDENTGRKFQSQYYFEVDEDDIEDYFTKDDLKNLFKNRMEQSFQDKFFPEQENENVFIQWGKKIIVDKLKKRLEEEE